MCNNKDKESRVKEHFWTGFSLGVYFLRHLYYVSLGSRLLCASLRLAILGQVCVETMTREKKAGEDGRQAVNLNVLFRFKIMPLKSGGRGPGGMTQLLRALPALPGDTGSISSTHRVANNTPNSSSKRIQCPLLIPVGNA